MAEVVNTNQFKNGMHIELDGGVWRIVEFQHVKPGKGGAFVRTKVKSVDTGAVVDRTFRAGEKFARVFTETKNVQYLYDDGSEVHFMDEETYEQFGLPHAELEDALPYMQPSSTVQMLVVGGKPIASWVPYTIFGFEVMVLIGGLSTVVGLLIYARVPRLTLQVGYDPRFSHGDYGVWVECAPEQARVAEELLRQHGAIEVRRER